jgi:hypothetical protein
MSKAKAKAKDIDINQIFLRAHKLGVKMAIEKSIATGTALISFENGKIKKIKPNMKYVCVPINAKKEK